MTAPQQGRRNSWVSWCRSPHVREAFCWCTRGSSEVLEVIGQYSREDRIDDSEDGPSTVRMTSKPSERKKEDGPNSQFEWGPGRAVEECVGEDGSAFEGLGEAIDRFMDEEESAACSWGPGGLAKESVSENGATFAGLREALARAMDAEESATCSLNIERHLPHGLRCYFKIEGYLPHGFRSQHASFLDESPNRYINLLPPADRPHVKVLRHPDDNSSRTQWRLQTFDEIVFKELKADSYMGLVTAGVCNQSLPDVVPVRTRPADDLPEWTETPGDASDGLTLQTTPGLEINPSILPEGRLIRKVDAPASKAKAEKYTSPKSAKDLSVADLGRQRTWMDTQYWGRNWFREPLWSRFGIACCLCLCPLPPNPAKSERHFRRSLTARGQGDGQHSS